MLEMYNKKSDSNINMFLLKKTIEYIGTYVEPKVNTLLKTLYDRLFNLFEVFFNRIKVLEDYKAKASRTRSNEEHLRRRIVELEGKLKASKNSRLLSKIDKARKPRRSRFRSRFR